MIGLKKQQAEALGYEGHAYDALLDEYEPEAKTADVAHVLGDLREQLVPMATSIKHSGRVPRTDVLKRDFPVETQKILAQQAAEAIGYRFQSRPIGRDGASVYRRPGSARLPHHHALRRAVFQRGVFCRHARGRPRPLRTGLAGGTLRAALGRNGFAGDPRIAIAAVGKCGRAEPGVLGAFFPQGASAISRRPWKTFRLTIFILP